MNIVDRFSKNTQISNFVKIGLVGMEFCANGQTDLTLIVASLHFVNASKWIKWKKYKQILKIQGNTKNYIDKLGQRADPESFTRDGLISSDSKLSQKDSLL